ncbi:nucleotidyltransferase domain-containing protein [Crocosphaera sp. XPORK-15E]|uniref:nucleotidyltransferase family protein n=1 Tax=Crocosphaera sp. XPORK-15E TaxID=3110247 RepID=UPI002B20F4E7|nr:nucleotidyltransferase domain-containing protein [Crocosphaera sp. XPORK-15E]MEA5536995.1 nucleotidyltransferase domain-containing protein [Crocosphaera sp. XPORK-15E]
MRNITLEERKQKALEIAKNCIQILKQEFGANDVIIFGSLRGDSPWHWESDLDLAVKRMSDEQIWDAYGKLEKILPSWLQFDLVPVEQVPYYVRDRILQTKPMSDNLYLALKTRLEDEMLAFEDNFTMLISLMDQAQTVPEAFVTPTLASYIVDVYTGCEHMSERVAVTLDGGLPTGQNWHEQLLRQMADPGNHNRPPLWQGSLLLELDEYPKFSHLVRHNYQVKLKAKSVLVLAKKLIETAPKVREAIKQFNQWLENQDNQT